ncbi:MAG: 50S ribosomal protein L22 [Patescibacteria group bacterium]|nr:50S ribosomal protein L22 [Patescibacteria group bacterium]
MKAYLHNYRQTPRKTRLVTEAVKGKSVADAITALRFLDKRAARPVMKLIASAAANAEKQGEDVRTLYVTGITVDKGVVLMRSMPRAFGRSAPIRHRMSHISVTLGKEGKKTKSQKRSPKKKNV